MIALRRVLIGSATLALVGVLFVGWLLLSASGTKAGLLMATAWAGADLSVGEVKGTLMGAMQIERLRFTDRETGIDLSIGHATVSMSLWDLPNRLVRVRQLSADDVSLTLEPRPERPETRNRGKSFVIELSNVLLHRATIRRGTWILRVDRAQLSGRYADGKLEVAGLTVRRGEDEISVAGALSLDPALTVRLDRLTGQLMGHGVSGDGLLEWRDDQTLTGEIQLRAGKSRLRVTGSRRESLDVTIDAVVESLAEWSPGLSGSVDGQIRITGDWPRIRMVASLRAADVTAGDTRTSASTFAGTLAIAARGSPHQDGWVGTLESLVLRVNGMPDMALQSAVEVGLRPGDFHFPRACLTGNSVALCASGSKSRDGRMSVEYSIADLPLALPARLFAHGKDLGIEGSLQGAGKLERSPSGALSGHATLGASIAGTGKLSGEATVSGATTRDLEVRGNVALELPDLSVLTVLLPQLAAITGSGNVVASIRGSVQAPIVTLEAQMRQVGAEIPALGLTLHSGSLQAYLEPPAAVRINARVTSGEGELALDGTATTERIQLTVTGISVLAADLPGARVVLSPSLRFGGTPQAPTLEGTLEVPQADIDLSKLTFTTGARTSPDVIVVDRKQPGLSPLGTLSSDLKVVLGPRVQLTGRGLDAMLEGQLHIREIAGEAAVATGEIRAAGTYEAYGRKLDIERGRLQYAGTSLSDPELDIVAVRKVQNITSKLHVSGTMHSPELNVSGDSGMSSAEALSYLVTGKPLDDLRGEENDAVAQAAAESVGGMVANRLTGNMAARFGLDSAGVQQSTSLGGAAFTVSKFLSPRFFVSYGVGLFEPGHVVSLSYLISRHWSLEADQAPEDQHAGLHYRIEK